MFEGVKNFMASLGKPNASTTPVISVADLNAISAFSGYSSTSFNGSKFPGGLNAPQIVWTDYWSLRLQSSKLFQENLYARGLIRRLVNNEINTGLTLEAIPDGNILDLDDDFRNQFSEDVEARFNIYSESPLVCDFKRKDTFGGLQRAVRAEALVTGDALVVLRMSPVTKVPAVQIIPGNRVQTPGFSQKVRDGHKIIHGVELNSSGIQVAYWVLQKDGTHQRLATFGEKTKRRKAWLVYGTDKRLDEVRGEPILALVMQSIKEIDRYRDSVQRKAVINSFLAMFIRKTEDKPGTLPMTGGAVKKGAVTTTDYDGGTRQFDIAQQIPGLVMEELQHGEEPVGFNSAGTDLDFGKFEESILRAIAWANEIPPEILLLSFDSNYSASRQAVSEFKMYLDKSRSERADEFGKPIYKEWLINEVLLGNVQAPGLLEAWRDPSKYIELGAWLLTDWPGALKPNVDLKKEVAGYQMMHEMGWITGDKASRELSNTKLSSNLKRIKKENEEWAEAMKPKLDVLRELNEGNAGTDEGVGGITALGRGEPRMDDDELIEALLERMREENVTH